MDNQHKKIKGYRDLSQEEINLMNKIKEKGSELLSAVDELKAKRVVDGDIIGLISDAQLNESRRCTALGVTNVQQGLMWLVRAIALPED